jgi:hypothetical protein
MVVMVMRNGHAGPAGVVPRWAHVRQGLVETGDHLLELVEAELPNSWSTEMSP